MPFIQIPRYGLLPLAPVDKHARWVLLDCHTGRIIDGVYFDYDTALADARMLNETDGEAEQQMPSLRTLCVIFPLPDGATP